MKDQMIFKRYEMKYLITKEQSEQIKQAMKPYMIQDEYGRSTICNLYFDTPSYLLIRRSIEKPVYKEKLRLRSYGVATDNSQTFVEIKKKYDSVVYKRRIGMKEQEAMKYLLEQKEVADTQITHEIDYFMEQYPVLKPRVFISYEREAFYAKEDDDFRVTFDENILWRKEALTLHEKVYGTPILEEGQVLMEIKTGNIQKDQTYTVEAGGQSTEVEMTTLVYGEGGMGAGGPQMAPGAAGENTAPPENTDKTRENTPPDGGGQDAKQGTTPPEKPDGMKGGGTPPEKPQTENSSEM